MRKYWKQLANTIILVTALISLISLALFASSLRAQSQTPPIGIDPALLVRANAGDATSQAIIAHAYLKGDGVRQDYAQAAFWYRKAAEQGDAKSQSFLGMLYTNGQGVPQDYLQAALWFRKAAEQGRAEAQFNLGVLCEKGQGLSQDYPQAALWFRKAAEQGRAEAEFNLGDLYYEGKGIPQDYALAAAWFRKAAEQGLPIAQSNLGLLYSRGQGVPKDYAQAVEWYRKAANQGYADAQFNLGINYERGQGTPQDYAQAEAWYRKAAYAGNAAAENQLGSLYYYGHGVPQDYATAADWCRKAADQGDGAAQSNLGDMYYLGRGVRQDDAEAISWYQKAGENGSTTAKAILPLLTERTVAATSSANRVTDGRTRAALSPQAIAKLASEGTVLIISADRSGRSGSLGSGFAIKPDLIVTNSHVFQDGRLGLVRKIGSDRMLHIGRVVLRDKERDIVLLYVPDLGLPSLPIQTSEPVVGDTVFTMGNPEGMEGTFSEGLVSALRNSKGVRMIQITAPISHGSSGGPVFNIYGEVIGISTSMITSGQSLNFAVPASAIDALLRRASPE